MIDFVASDHRCRMVKIQQYFDEETVQTCGICDVCIANRKAQNHTAFEGMRIEVLNVIKNNLLTLDQLEEIIAPADQELFIDVIRDLLDEGQLEYDDVWRLRAAKQNGRRGV